MLRANPDLAAQVRARLQNSGLTPDQVRARLRDEGYPENLLDAYLTPGATSDTSSMPPATLAAALRALSVQPDSADFQAAGSRVNRPWEAASRNTIKCDTVAVPAPSVDSLPLDARTRPRSSRTLKCVSSDGTPVAPPDSGRTIFGLDMFAGQTSQFDPNVVGPVDASYKLGLATRSCCCSRARSSSRNDLDVNREGFIFILRWASCTSPTCRCGSSRTCSTACSGAYTRASARSGDT